MGGSNQIGGLQCEVSAKSIMDYGHNIVLSTGNFLASAPLVNSTMDFSKKRVKDEVVDSPIERKEKVAVGNSASSLHAKERKAATMSVSDVVRLMRRKVYEDANYGTIGMEVPATSLNERQDVGGHAALSTLSGGRCYNVLYTVLVWKRKRDA